MFATYPDAHVGLLWRQIGVLVISYEPQIPLPYLNPKNQTLLPGILIEEQELLLVVPGTPKEGQPVVVGAVAALHGTVEPVRGRHVGHLFAKTRFFPQHLSRSQCELDCRRRPPSQ